LLFLSFFVFSYQFDYFALTGQLICKLGNGKLPETAVGVPSFRDGVIAVPGWDDGKLHLFKVT